MVHWRHTLWCTLLLLFSDALNQCLASPTYVFENTAIVRIVELGGSIAHSLTTYAIKATQPNANRYSVVLNSNERSKISWIQAKIKGEDDVLAISDSFDPSKDYYILDLTLPKPLSTNETTNIVLEIIYGRATSPWPKEATQTDEQSLKYQTDLLVISPYPTTVQRMKLRTLIPRIISFTKPANIEKFTLEEPVTKSGATVTYGPYHKLPPSTGKEFISRHQQRVDVLYHHDQPVLEVNKLLRTAEISHWGANLNIQDEIAIKNTGPALKGHFSRKEHQSQLFFQRPASHVLSALSLQLPPGIRNAYYYDTIGNVSTSNLRVTPSAGKNADASRFSVFEFRPRYPLLGGWNYSFTLGWDSPLSNSAVWDKSTGKYVVEVPIMTSFSGALVIDAEVQIILPEGAIDIEFVTPFPPLSSEITTHKTFLDSVGRPRIAFKYKNLTVFHAQNIYISYRVPLAAHLRKPLAVAVAVFSLFTIAIIGRRIDFTLNKEKAL